MKIIGLLVAIAFAAAVVSAECTLTDNLYEELLSDTSCPPIAACQSDLCSCMGTTDSGTGIECLKKTDKQECEIEGCLTTAMHCIEKAVATNNNNQACNTIAAFQQIYTRQTLLSDGQEKWATSKLKDDCESFVCVAKNYTQATCEEFDDANICISPTSLHAQLKLKGGSWGMLVNDAAKAKELKVLLVEALSDLLKILKIIVQEMEVGSLIAPFATPGTEPSDATRARMAGASKDTAWLNNVKNFYKSTTGADDFGFDSLFETDLTGKRAQQDDDQDSGLIIGLAAGAIGLLIIVGIAIWVVTKRLPRTPAAATTEAEMEPTAAA